VMFFRNFTAPLWEIFVGNLLLLLCSISYLAWWIVSFRPDTTAGASGPSGGMFITFAFITGFAAIASLSVGFSSVADGLKGIPVWSVLLGSATLFFVLLPVTSVVFQRPVTSELLIIHTWLALELSVIVVLASLGRFGAGRTVILSSFVGIATIVGLVCYMLYYRLDAEASYRVGMIPLIVDAVVMTVILFAAAVS
jgi:hypothetical protein